MLTELAFRSLVAGSRLSPETLLQTRLRALYFSPAKREELYHRLQSIYTSMVICRDVTARENGGKTE